MHTRPDLWVHNRRNFANTPTPTSVNEFAKVKQILNQITTGAVMARRCAISALICAAAVCALAGVGGETCTSRHHCLTNERISGAANQQRNMSLSLADVKFFRSCAVVSSKRSRDGLSEVKLLPRPEGSDAKLVTMKVQVTEGEKARVLAKVPSWAVVKGAREGADAIALRCIIRDFTGPSPPDWFTLAQPAAATMAQPATAVEARMDAEDFSGVMEAFQNGIDVQLRREKEKNINKAKVVCPSCCLSLS